MKLNLSPRERQTLLLGGILAVVLLWAYVAYLIGPMMRDLGALARQVRSAQDEVRLLEAGTASEAALREQHRQVAQSVMALRKLLPAEAELNQTIERLSALAGQAQVKIQTISPQRESQEASSKESKESKEFRQPAIQDALITIDALAGYHQLGTFLSLMEAENRSIEVASLWIAADPRELRRHRVKLTRRAYLAADQG